MPGTQIVDIEYERDPATGAFVWDANGYPVQLLQAANTYQDLQNRIANEVLGSPSASDIQNAIQDAIGIYDGTNFWFNTFRFDGSVSGSGQALTTVPGKEFYGADSLSLLINYPHISGITVVAFSNRYTMTERTAQWMEDNSVSTNWQGLPTDYCFAGGSLRIFPVPDAAYNLILTATIRLPPLLGGGTYSAWTNAGERLIRLEAKRLLFVDIIRDQAQAQAMALEIHGMPGIRGELGRLRAETLRRSGGSGRLRPSRGYL